jgi:ketosteroid isomerase-like protein
MSEENVEIVRALIPAPGTDVAELLRDDDRFGALKSAVEPLIAPDVESVALWQPGTARTYVGIDGFRQLWLDWLEPWARYRVRQVDDLIDAGDRVVALVRDSAMREDVDAEVEIVAGSVWTFRDGKLARVEFCTREDALGAAGRSE